MVASLEGVEQLAVDICLKNISTKILLTSAEMVAAFSLFLSVDLSTPDTGMGPSANIRVSDSSKF